jgi:hypothetical protein
MLRIPTSLDTPSPLIAPRRAADESAGEGSARGFKKRRRKKADSAESLAWEDDPKSSRAGNNGKDQTGLLLIGGVVMLVLVAVGVFFAKSSGIKPVIQPLGPLAEPVAAVRNPDEAVIPRVAQRSEAALQAEAELLARKFLEATAVEDLLPLVRNPEVAEARMRGFYPGGKIEAPGMQPLGSGAGLVVRGKLVSLAVRTRDFEEKSLAFIDTPQGLKIDWESWAGWSEISWKEFMATKPTSSHVFRVILAPVDYYNFEFTDDQKWQSYRLESPDHEHALYGYAEKGTVLNGNMLTAKDAKRINLMLSLKFPADATSNNQVLIDRFVAEGWVEEGPP